MKIYKIASTINELNLSKWILDIVNIKYGGPESAVEGWCGEIAGEIFKYLKENGENSEIWSIVQWLDDKPHPKTIDNPTSALWHNIDSQIIGVMAHSMVKWNDKWWDGKGTRSLVEIMTEQSWGIESLGSETSLMREDLVSK